MIYSYIEIFVIELRFEANYNPLVTERNEPPLISYRTNLGKASNEPKFDSLEALCDAQWGLDIVILLISQG